MRWRYDIGYYWWHYMLVASICIIVAFHDTRQRHQTKVHQGTANKPHPWWQKMQQREEELSDGRRGCQLFSRERVRERELPKQFVPMWDTMTVHLSIRYCITFVFSIQYFLLYIIYMMMILHVMHLYFSVYHHHRWCIVGLWICGKLHQGTSPRPRWGLP